jgi:hypothetical protein
MKLHANAQTCPHCRSLMVSKVMDGVPAGKAKSEYRAH